MRIPLKDKEQATTSKLRQRVAQYLFPASQLKPPHLSLAAASGVYDEAILADLQTAGYTQATVKLLWLMPSLQVAWADSYVSFREGDLLMRAARARGALAERSACEQLLNWLDGRPAEACFEKSLRLIRAILQTMRPAERALLKEDLLAHCLEIAAASCEKQGFGRHVTVAEQAVINQLAARL